MHAHLLARRADGSDDVMVAAVQDEVGVKATVFAEPLVVRIRPEDVGANSVRMAGEEVREQAATSGTGVAFEGAVRGDPVAGEVGEREQEAVAHVVVTRIRTHGVLDRQGLRPDVGAAGVQQQVVIGPVRHRPGRLGIASADAFQLGGQIKHDWSPDGTRIALAANADFVRPDESPNLVTIGPDGFGVRRLTRFASARKNAYAGSFSPDGKQIVFRLERGDKYGLAVVDRDGRNLRLLTTPSGDSPRFVDWGTHP